MILNMLSTDRIDPVEDFVESLKDAEYDNNGLQTPPGQTSR